MDDTWLSQEFGAAFRRIRQDADMTQDDISLLAGISRTSVVNIEKGRQGVSLHTLYRLAQALDVPPATLLPTPPAPEAPHITHGDSSERGRQALQAVLRRANEDSVHR